MDDLIDEFGLIAVRFAMLPLLDGPHRPNDVASALWLFILVNWLQIIALINIAII